MSAKLASRPMFSVASANRMLPLVRMIVGDIVDLFRDVRDREERLNGLRKGDARNIQRGDLYDEEVEQIRLDLEKDVERLQGFVDELLELGVEFKDPVIGLIDFPAMMDGQEVSLCWKLGEPTITHWHTLDAGFSGRQLLKLTDMDANETHERN